MSYILSPPRQAILDRQVHPNKQYNWWQAHYGTLLAGQEVSNGAAVVAANPDGRVLWRMSGTSQLQLGPITSGATSDGYLLVANNPIVEFCVIPREVNHVDDQYQIGLYYDAGGGVTLNSIVLLYDPAAIPAHWFLQVTRNTATVTSADSNLDALVDTDLYGRLVITAAGVDLWLGYTYETMAYRCQVLETGVLLPTVAMHGSAASTNLGAATPVLDLWWLSTQQDL